jgi:hypothetical protein
METLAASFPRHDQNQDRRGNARVISSDIEHGTAGPFHREVAAPGDMRDWNLISLARRFILKT